jgi:hypothetical protein
MEPLLTPCDRANGLLLSTVINTHAIEALLTNLHTLLIDKEPPEIRPNRYGVLVKRIPLTQPADIALSILSVPTLCEDAE